MDSKFGGSEAGPISDGGGSRRNWRRATKSSSVTAPLLAAGASCVLFCCNGELLQALQLHAGGGQPSPLVNLALCHVGGLLFMPRFLWTPAELPPSVAPQPWPPCASVYVSSLAFALLLMGYNYMWLMSARSIAVGVTNAIFQTSVAFVYIASVRVFKEPVTAPQLAGVALALIGAALAGGLASSSTHIDVKGVLFALVAALGYTVYQVLFKYMFSHLKNNWSFLAHFGVWISLWHVLAIMPLVWLASIAGIEKMHLPHGTFPVVGTMVTALLASAVNALYLCIMMWGSPMLLPCASTISVPLTVALDALLHGARPGVAESLGHVLVVASVVLILHLHAPSRHV